MNQENIFEISHRLIALQTAHVSLQEERLRNTHAAEQQLDDMALGIIDILDLTGSFHACAQADTDTVRVLKKVDRRLKSLLDRFSVREIEFSEGEFTPGLVRVLETRSDLEHAEICRKGYARGNRVLRPVEVVANGSGQCSAVSDQL